MRRIVGFTLCLLAIGVTQAKEKLQVINLGENIPASAEAAERGKQYVAAQATAADIKPQEAREFLMRLRAAVQYGQKLVASGSMNGKQARDQAIALNTLQDEGSRFGAVFAPYGKCNAAAIDAAASWRALTFKNYQQHEESFRSYRESAEQCEAAAD